MATAYITHDACLAHEMGVGHPERSARLDAIERELVARRVMAHLLRFKAPPADDAALCRVHDPVYVEAIKAASPAEGMAVLDADTAMNPHSLDAARHAAGAGMLAVDLVMEQRVDNAFCAVRPPGHHAEYGRAMGFCIFNNVAVAAAHALEVYGLERVVIADFDVHHGNGTEDIFRNDSRVLYCSTYQHPFYPFATPLRDHPHLVHAPLPAGSGGRQFRKAVTRFWLPAMKIFAPQFIFISAGFDAHVDDPLAGLALTEEDYVWVTRCLLAVAEEYAGGRLVSLLEGGYDLVALGRSAAAHVATLAGLDFSG